MYVHASCFPLACPGAATLIVTLRTLGEHRLTTPINTEHHHLIKYKGEIKRSTCRILSCAG